MQIPGAGTHTMKTRTPESRDGVKTQDSPSRGEQTLGVVGKAVLSGCGKQACFCNPFIFFYFPVRESQNTCHPSPFQEKHRRSIEPVTLTSTKSIRHLARMCAVSSWEGLAAPWVLGLDVGNTARAGFAESWKCFQPLQWLVRQPNLCNLTDQKKKKIPQWKYRSTQPWTDRKEGKAKDEIMRGY